jgi:hypothetical protein
MPGSGSFVRCATANGKPRKEWPKEQRWSPQARSSGVLALARERGGVPLPENESVKPERVIALHPRRSPNEVREGAF